MSEESQKSVKIVTADPSAIGLFGLAMVTLVASTEKLGWTEGTSLILPWAFFLGGLAQFYASYLDSKHNNVFGTTAFGAFGLFWIGVGATWLIQMGALGDSLFAHADGSQLGVAFVGYLIFSLFMTVGAMGVHKVMFIIFLLIDGLFLGLSLSTFGILEGLTSMLAAVSEFLIALFSFYGSAAAVLNAHFGKVILPVGKPFALFEDKVELKEVA